MYKLDFYTAISNRNDPKTLNHFERVSGYGQVVRTPRGREIEFGFAELLSKVDKVVESNTYKAVVKALSEFKTNSEVA